jgi:hypothetical protein
MGQIMTQEEMNELATVVLAAERRLVIARNALKEGQIKTAQTAVDIAYGIINRIDSCLGRIGLNDGKQKKF